MSTRTQGVASAPPVERLGEANFLASYLEHWARESPEATSINYVDHWADRHGLQRTTTYAELELWSRQLAARIAQLTEPGDRVALLAPQGLPYGVGFAATLRTAAISVPLFAPDLPGQGTRLVSVVADCEPSLILTSADKLDLVRAFAAEHTALAEDRVLAIDDFREPNEELAAAYSFPPIELDDPAYLQYTSGSTRVPAGVVLTHRNLVRNAMQLKKAYTIEFQDATTVSWLPLFHDMGLILGVASPLFGGLETVILDPVAFIFKPVRWLQAISGRRNVMTAAPNFAFDYTAKRVKESDREGLDLSGVLAWINGAEPVLPATLEQFQSTFAANGVRPRDVKPTYGLAEATVFVATTPFEESATVIEVDSYELQHGVVTTDIAAGTRGTKLIACGAAVDQHLAIVDPDTGELLPDGRVGEIWIHGPNVGIGLWRKPEQTEALFNGHLKGGGDLPEHGWLRTEDLGAYSGGRFYVTGRIKDLIIIDGRNIYPHDVEFTVEESHEGIAQRRLAAFSVPGPGGETMVVVAERYRHAADAGAQLDEIARAASRAVSEQHAVALHEFILVEPDTIARTSSGKIARKATREAYLAGALQRTPAA